MKGNLEMLEKIASEVQEIKSIQEKALKAMADGCEIRVNNGMTVSRMRENWTGVGNARAHDILGLCDIIDQLQNKNKILRDRIEASLRIKDLWLSDSKDPEYEDEVKALQIMKDDFEMVLEETK